MDYPQVAYMITKNGATPLRAQGERKSGVIRPLMLLRRTMKAERANKVRFASAVVISFDIAMRSDFTEGVLSVQVYGIRTDGKMKLYEWAREN